MFHWIAFLSIKGAFNILDVLNGRKRLSGSRSGDDGNKTLTAWDLDDFTRMAAAWRFSERYAAQWRVAL